MSGLTHSLSNHSKCNSFEYNKPSLRCAMSSSDLSELSSSPLSEDDLPESIPKGKLEHYFKQGLSALPPKVRKKRPPSPPHEFVLADNPDIAVSITRNDACRAHFGACPLLFEYLADLMTRSSFACSDRALPMPSPSLYPITARKTSNEELWNLHQANKLKDCCVHCWGCC